jgi:hypothetical protein
MQTYNQMINQDIAEFARDVAADLIKLEILLREARDTPDRKLRYDTRFDTAQYDCNQVSWMWQRYAWYMEKDSKYNNEEWQGIETFEAELANLTAEELDIAQRVANAIAGCSHDEILEILKDNSKSKHGEFVNTVDMVEEGDSGGGKNLDFIPNTLVYQRAMLKRTLEYMDVEGVPRRGFGRWKDDDLCLKGSWPPVYHGSEWKHGFGSSTL